MQFNGYVHFYGTKSIEKTHQFYSEFLGFKMWKDQSVCRIYTLPCGGYIGFCEHMEFASKGHILTLLTDDVDGVYKDFVEKGIPIREKPKLNEKYKIYHFFATDLDGHTLEIQKFL